MITLDSNFVETLKAERLASVARQEEEERQNQVAQRQELIDEFTKLLDENFDGLYVGEPDDLRISVGELTFEFTPKSYRDYSSFPAHIRLIKSCPDCGMEITGSIVESKEGLAYVLAKPYFQHHNCGVVVAPVQPEPTVKERLIECLSELIEETLAPVYEAIGYAQEAADRVSEKAAKRAADLEYRLREQAQNHEYELESVRRTAEEAKRK